MLDSALAPNTKAVYTQAEKSYNSFLLNCGLKYLWPPNLDYLIKLIAFLSRENYSPSTVRSYISGIGYKLKISNLEDLTQSFILKKMLSGYDRLHSRHDIREPISIEMMEQMPYALSHVCFSKYEKTLFFAAFSLAFSAFLRVGELTIRSNKDFDHVLNKNDVLIDTSRGTVFLTVRFSKTDQMGLLRLIKIEI